MSENKTGKYFKYAIGEIILVVIGILIALQINTWNQQRLSKKKEQSYLIELKASLESDKLRIKEVLKFNVGKDSIVANLMRIFESQLNNEQRMDIIENYATAFTDYEFFKPNRTTWNNFLSAENIDLIQDKTLRTLLMDYYSFDYEGSVQERIKIMNRKVIDENFPKFFTKEYVERNLNITTDLPRTTEFNLHLNQTLLSDLFGVRYLINAQNKSLTNTDDSIDIIVDLINSNIQ